ERVQQTLFHPGAPYVKAFDLSDCRDITVKADSAVFLMNGWYEVITISNADNITIEGLTIAYHRPPNTVGTVIRSDSLSFDIRFDPQQYNYIDSIVTGRVHFYDHTTDRLYTGRVTSKTLIDPSTIRMASDRHPAIDDKVIIRHGGHYRPAIMIKESDNVSIKDVTIHSQPGMGIVGHLSSDICIDGLSVVPRAGQVISTNTDATHFTSCSGKLIIKNSNFAGQGDDCTNVHNYYYRFMPRDTVAAEIRIENADLHAQSLDYPTVGDTMIIVNRRNLAEHGRYAVTRVDTSEVSSEVIVTLDRKLPTGDITNLVMTNISRHPAVEIVGNTVNSHLARAFLIKSPNAVIARNHINGSCETAIKLGTELGWNESGPVYNMLIEDNVIENCGYCSHPSQPTCILVNTDAPEQADYANHDIIIRNNRLSSHRRPAILLKDTRDVIISGNAINADDYLSVDNCQNIITQ
ncbi:MAG: right-handed parallel beta-helix repeat-containing protein, partial [Muribaculaceae bacterium]|nr:right-handed parallel beta-helix repeat-containing protein [Muribaculaceae bacterium]